MSQNPANQLAVGAFLVPLTPTSQASPFLGFQFDTTKFAIADAGGGFLSVGLTTGVGSTLVFGNGGVCLSTTPRFLTPGFNPSNAPSVIALGRAVVGGIFNGLTIEHSEPAAVAGTIIYTLFINGVATSLSVTLQANAATGSDNAHSVPYNAGDTWSIQVTKPLAISASPSNVIATLSSIA
jgi:hypothetical protein